MVQVVLVDKHGQEVGVLEKSAAHRNPGFLHKAISVVLWRSSKQDPGLKEVLLQKRSEHKPLWPGFWANTVCTHPLPGESNLDCAVRRLPQEIGVTINKNSLKELFTFYYQADYDDEWSEHELDTVIVGQWDGQWKVNLQEVAECEWLSETDLYGDITNNPDKYCPWFHLIMNHPVLKEQFNGQS